MEELSTWTNLFMANAMIQNHCLDICRLAQNQPQPISPAFWALLLSLKPFVLNRHWVRWLVWLDWQLSIWWLGQAFPTPVHSIRYTSGKSHSKRLASLRVTPQSLANSCTRGNIDVSWVFPSYLSMSNVDGLPCIGCLLLCAFGQMKQHSQTRKRNSPKTEDDLP